MPRPTPSPASSGSRRRCPRFARRSRNIGHSCIVRTKRGSVPVMSAINAQGRLVFRFYDKRITSTEVIEFLGQLLREHPRRHLVVVMDQAPPHTSKLTTDYIEGQRRLHVFHLPAYSPDWNPDEKVWNHLKHQERKGHQAKNKAEMGDLAEHKLTAMS